MGFGRVGQPNHCRLFGIRLGMGQELLVRRSARHQAQQPLAAVRYFSMGRAWLRIARLTIHSSRSRFAARLNSGVRHRRMVSRIAVLVLVSCLAIASEASAYETEALVSLRQDQSGHGVHTWE